MPSKKAPAAKTAKPAMASGIVIPPHSTASMAEAVKQPDADTTQPGADALLGEAAASAHPGQEPELPAPPVDDAPAAPAPSPALAPDPTPEPAVGRPAYLPIYDLPDARALPDVTHGVYQRAEFDSPLAIRAFKDNDGRSMAVVFTGYTLAKAAITD